ncbi:uncharacterized protein CELE_F45D3.3 [Caenorhabditis elegans]|uniref:Secreted protein n=1 Tax=Caenorhabditis elegans TaxID=6239 RepID=Q20421_CAEEL|nr:Secreted protein [Caenorhabditis elegans]CAB01502.1 Secreted protein [Caenorhabditis elegans]|eukprot:NP_506142.1 Uncharacterized protein CELE_F45D3.3 [Caenorhabditis elegans]
MNFSLLIATAFLVSLVVAKSMDKPMEKSDATDDFDLDLFLGSMGDGHFANVDMDGVETMVPKKSEKLPGQKKMKPEFQQPEGVAPEFTGGFMGSDEAVLAAEPSTQKTDEIVESAESDSSSDTDYFGEASASAPVSNPALTYLSGANFDNVKQPSCQMLGCTGPIPNDGSYAAMSASLENKACSQIFVPMNGCTDNKGYPMGMLCSVCCDCANSFVQEMKKTFGYKANVDTAVFSS